MSLKSYLKIAIFASIINLVSIFSAVFAVWSAILLIFSIFIVSNRDSEKLLKDKKVMSFIQGFLLCMFTFIFTVFGVTLFPIMHHVVKNYLSSIYYLFLLLGIIGVISYYYLFVKLLIETIKVMKQKEV